MINQAAHPLLSNEFRHPPTRRVGRAFLRLLLASTALGAPMHGTALAANFVIEGGAAETVNGDGSGTKPSPWNIGGDLLVGSSGDGTLNIMNGGSVSNTDATVSAVPGARGSVLVSGGDSYWYSSGVLRVARDYVGVLLISDGGTVETDGGVIIADLATSGGRIVIGDEYWKTPVAPGALIAGEVSFGAGSGGLFFNHTADDYEFDAGISGRGDIRVDNGTTILLGDSSGFNGTTTIYGGSLFVNGLLGGRTIVDGLLGGSGTVGGAMSGTYIRAAGRLAPVNSIGRLAVAGDLVFEDDSTYEVEVNDGGNKGGVNNDFTSVGGMLTIGSDVMVNVLAANGTDDGSTYAPSTLYTILTANDGIAEVVRMVYSRRSSLTSERRRSSSLIIWTVYVSSFRRRPR